MKLAQARSQNTRSAILKAAKTLFAERGYMAATMDELASRAGISKASIFAHFAGKQAILATLGIADLQALLVATERQMEKGLPFNGELLMQCYRPWLGFFLGNPDFARLYLVQSGLISSAESREYVALCGQHEMLLAQGIALANPHLAPDCAMIVRGAQAHFQQALVYRLSGWFASDSIAAEALAQALSVWCAGINGAFNRA